MHVNMIVDQIYYISPDSQIHQILSISVSTYIERTYEYQLSIIDLFFLVRLGCLAERSDKTNIIHVNIGNIVTFCVPISKHLNNMFHMWHCKNINISISNIISIYICCVPRSAPWNIPRFSPIYPHLLHQTAVLMGTPLPGSAAASAGEQVNILR